jgi:hypothetical protein
MGFAFLSGVVEKVAEMLSANRTEADGNSTAWFFVASIIKSQSFTCRLVETATR